MSYELNLADNQFAGSIDFTKLPATIEWIELRGNHLTGTADLIHLPQGMQALNLADNMFTGLNRGLCMCAYYLV